MHKDIKALSKLYDAQYYAFGCGKKYERNEAWLDFFQNIADRIIEEIAPKTVLDAGCAMGFLVEGFRNRGVEAWGIDISEYAIQKVHPGISPYCWVGSVTEPLPMYFDLIISIEVLEHLPEELAEKTISNLCDHTTDIIFSSSPDDFVEPTHLNVQSLEYWAELFAYYGFYRDLEYEASYVTAWAARFRRMGDPLPRHVRNYERRLRLINKENEDLRTALSSTHAELNAAAAELEKYKHSRVIRIVNSLLETRRGLLKKKIK